jgi:hypothetical protein
MSKLVRLDPEAEEEIAAGIDWYEKQRPGLGAEFLDEITVAMRSLQAPGPNSQRRTTTASSALVCSGQAPPTSTSTVWSIRSSWRRIARSACSMPSMVTRLTVRPPPPRLRTWMWWTVSRWR